MATEIPEWLQPRKNEWLSRTVLARLFCTASGRPFPAWFDSVKDRCRSISQDYQPEKQATYYLVKSVWAAAQAHGVELVENTQPQRDRDQPWLRSENQRLTRRVAALEAELECVTRQHQQLRDDLAGVMPRASLTALLVQAQEPKPAPGVYFLIEGDEIVYVGQSKNVLARMAGHADKRFSRVKMIPTSVEGLLSFETRMIEALQPRYNRARNPGRWHPASKEGVSL